MSSGPPFLDINPRSVTLRLRAMRKALTAVALILSVSCGEFSPFQSDLPSGARRLTEKNLRELAAGPLPSGEFAIALIADTHSYYADLKDALDNIGLRGDVAFAVLLGDLTDAGLREEYLRLYDVLKASPVPYFTVLASHDTLSNGKDIYREMFGPFEYSFAYGGCRLVMFNSNKLDFESGVPDFGRLEAELQTAAAYENTIVFSHVPPISMDGTGLLAGEVGQWKTLMEKYGAKLSVSGHLHGALSWRESGVRYIVVPWVKGVRYGILRVGKDGISYELCRRLTCEPVP